MRFELIDRAKKDFLVQRLCRVLGVSQSGYFAWRSRLPSRRQREDMVLLAHVRSAFALSNGTYGSPRMTREIRDQGLAMGRRRTGASHAREWPTRPAKAAFQADDGQRACLAGCAEPAGPGFTAMAPNQKWSADISYVWTKEGWLYLAIVMDLFSRRIIGWSVSDRLHRNLALAALRQALVIRCPTPGLICHSDRGSQYCSIDYQSEFRRYGAHISMSGKGNCFDNAIVETFFKTLKSELVWRTVFLTRKEAESAIGSYIDSFYNPVRRHSSLDFISPAAYERQAA